MYQNYEEFNVSKEKCRDCEIGRVYNRVVLSDGNTINPIVVVIGEAAGSSEVEIGKPFVGKAGKLLRATLNLFGYNKGNSLITNTIPCRPKDNVFPKDEELIIKCMDKWLFAEIDMLKPKYLLLIGATPTKYILDMSGITKIRGQIFHYNNIPSIPTYHPSFVLRKQYMAEGKDIKECFEKDIKMVATMAGFKK